MIFIRHGKLGKSIRIMFLVAELKIITLIIETKASLGTSIIGIDSYH